MTDETAAPTPQPEDQPDTYTDLTARLAAADLGWSHEHGDPPANPDYIRWLAFQVMAFKPPLIAGVYVDDEMLDDMRDRLHGDNCGCGEWDSHSQEYVERMDETIHAVLYPLRHPVRPVSQGTEDSDYREQTAELLHAAAVDVPGTPQVGPALIERQIAALWPRVSPLVEQLRQARAAYNRMAGHAVDRAAERDRYYLAWQSAARGRRQARQQWQTWQREAEQWQAETVESAKATQGLRADLETRTCERDEARQELAGEKHVRKLNEHGLLGQLAALRSTAVVLPEDWEQRLGDCPSSGAGVDLVASWRAAPVDEHVREHDDSASTRDEVVEAWAATWDGVDRTPLPEYPDISGGGVPYPTPGKTVTVINPCPVSGCTIGELHGHEGYGPRFAPAAQPEPQGEPRWLLGDTCEAKLDGQWRESTIHGVRVDDDSVQFLVTSEDTGTTCLVFEHDLRPIGSVVDIESPGGSPGAGTEAGE